MLAEQVPARLAAIRAAATHEPDCPKDPKSYQLADSLPTKEEQYPCVLITASQATPYINLQAGLGEAVYEYTLTIQIAYIASRHGGESLASLGRDRILLAVREALLLNARLADDCEAFVRNASEQTGAAVESMQSQPMSLGNITFTVRVDEELTDPLLDVNGNPVVITSTNQSITAVDALQPLEDS
jgi:hypothetical protein